MSTMNRFLRRWGMTIFLAMAGLMMAGMLAEDRRVVAAKLRIANDRQAIAETRRKVEAIENWLHQSHVPDRLERIEAAQQMVLDALVVPPGKPGRSPEPRPGIPSYAR